ncbi:MAG TPA: hypothetical protein VF507_01500 [Pyrinomonadaceae bacterium]
MAEQNRQVGNQETMAGNLKEKPADAESFDAGGYAGETGPSDVGPHGSGSGPNVSTQGGGTGSSKQGGNTGGTPNASG